MSISNTPTRTPERILISVRFSLVYIYYYIGMRTTGRVIFCTRSPVRFVCFCDDDNDDVSMMHAPNTWVGKSNGEQKKKRKIIGLPNRM